MRFSRRAFLVQTSAIIGAPHVARAQASVSDEMIAEMLIVGFAGASGDADSARNLARHIAAGRAGGACFLGHNTRSREGIESLTALFQGAGRRWKPLVAVDQEGGAVQRLSNKLGYPAIPAAQAVAARKDVDEARKIYAAMAGELRAAGFNFNMAPVVDLGFEPRNPIVAKFGRAFGPDGETVARYAGACVAAHRSTGVLTALKHFPGHGSTLTDSHAKPVDITSTWRPDELEPFRRLTRAGLVDVVMSGHLSHAKLTGGEPATLSKTAIDGVLRRDIGYDGAVMTDDLDMAAIRSRYQLDDAVIRAIAAGNDLILLSNSLTPEPDMPLKIIAAVKDAVVKGRLRASQIESASRRIAELKSRIG